MTALALDCFARELVDIAVVETGLGGRLDATNVLSPCLTITTHISRDHTEILGSTIGKIAWEKAGIVKPAVPHLIGRLPREAVKVMCDMCQKQKAPLQQLRLADYRTDRERFRLDFSGQTFRMNKVALSLCGEHQMQNGALVLKAVDILNQNGMMFRRSSIRKGLTEVEWPGRFQILARNGKPTVVLDVCHNASGAQTFAATFARRFPGRTLSIILGLVKRKEHQLIVDALAPIASDFSLVPLKTRRSVDLDELISCLNWSGVPVRKYGRLSTAYSHLVKSARADDYIGMVGSHYLVGEFLRSCTDR